MKNLSGGFLCLGVSLNVLTSNEIGVFGYLSIGSSMITIIAILFDIFSNKTKYKENY